jgi:hypothetical protein
MKAVRFFVFCLVVIFVFLVPLGEGKGGSTTLALPIQDWSLSILESGASSSADYQISDVTWRVEGISTGGAYRLESASEPLSTGSGCCCTYLPCVIK